MDGKDKVQIVIEAEDKASKAINGIDADLRGMGPAAQRSTAQVNSGFASMTSAAVTASGAIAAAMQALKFGDEYSQSMFRFTATFGSSSGDVIAQAQKMSAATRNAVSVQELADSMTRTADSMQRYGLDGSKYMEMVGRAMDVASAKGLSLEQAIMRIESAMLGEAEASEYLGLTLNDTYMKNVAFGGSLRNTWEKLGDVEKAQYRFTELMKQSDKYAGSAAASTNTLGGALTALANDIKNNAGPALAEYSKDLAYIINVYRQGLQKGTAPGFTEMFDFGVTGFGKQEIQRQGLIDSLMAQEKGTPFSRPERVQDMGSVQRVWDDYKHTAEAAIKDLDKLQEQANKQYVSSLKQSLDQALSLRGQYADKIQAIEKSIQEAQSGGKDMLRDIKRRGMTPELAQADLESEARSKRSDSYTAASKGDFTTAIDLAKQAQQIAFNLNNQEKAASGVRAATQQLNQVLEQQKRATQSADQEVQQYADDIKANLDAAKSPAQALKQQIDSINEALKAAGQTPVSIDTSSAVSNVQRLESEIDTVTQKLDEFIQKANQGGNFTVTFKGQASPVKELSATISDIMGKLNSLPTGSEYKMNFSMGIPGYESNRLIGTGAGSYLEGNVQWAALLASKNSFVTAMVEAGSSVSDAMDIFAEFASGAAERLKIAGQIYANWQDYGYLKDAGTYQIDAWKTQQQARNIELEQMITNALYNSGSTPAETSSAGSMYPTATDVNIERAVDVGSIIVNLNGGSGGMDNARIIAEELDAQLAEMVASNRSRLKAALKANWS